MATALASCGIDTIEYFPLKTTVSQTSGSAMTFSGPESDDSNYLGLAIFYKIYASEAKAITDQSYVNSKQSAINTVPGAIVESTLISAGGLGYQRLILTTPATGSSASAAIPTIAKAYLTSDYFVSISFPAGSEPRLTVTNEASGAVSEFLIRRSVAGSTGAYLTFLDEPASGNSDYVSSATSALEGTYFVQFFAAAYGLNPNTLTDLYGDAVFLNRITINL
ncbi:MAG: hypothetical protein KKA67_11730 [Spirochaetes bacterium]|nr:hypothetical protein [Spirochaetota bacterium]MBU1081328.1 hypothetical protein [Spirochaetota bacterium]